MNKCDVRKELIKFQEHLAAINKLIRNSEVVTPTMYQQKKEIENKIKEVKKQLEDKKVEKIKKEEKPVKNYNLNYLNEILFQQLEKLNTSDNNDLELEIRRSYAIQGIAFQITNAANTQIKAIKLNQELNDDKKQIPQVLDIEK